MTLSCDTERLDALLNSALNLAPFEGWSGAMLEKACLEADITLIECEMLAPRGAIDLVCALADRADRAMVSALKKADLAGMKVRARIAFAIRTRLESLADHKEAVRRSAYFLALPHNAADAAKIGWASADQIWRALDDPSTDFNWYTKRGILAGVHAATLGRWLQDDSLDNSETWAFLDARIENIMQFEKAKSKAAAAFEKLPDLTGLLARLRYGR
jgi:ubiquinone biosynthesis protein COQ9